MDSSELESVSLDSSIDDKTNTNQNAIVSEESLEHSDETEEELEADKLVKL